MKHIFSITIITATIISTLLSIFASCKNNINHIKETVNISITTDENIDVRSNSIDVKIGSKWRSVKRNVLSCIQCKKGYRIDKLILKDDDQDLIIRSNFTFEEDASIYITSKRDSLKEHDDESEESDEKICIKIKGDRHINIEDDEVTIEKGQSWKDIKEEIIERLEFEEGYRFNRCKLTSSRGRTLYDEYLFKKDTTIYAMSKKQTKQNPEPELEPEEMIMINLKGDENVILEYNTLEVHKCMQWKDIKDTEYMQSASTKAGFHLSGWHLTENVNTPEIEDGYKFCKNTNIFVFALSDDPNPDTPDPQDPSDNQNPEIRAGDDEIMIDVLPSIEGIKCSPIDYPLPNISIPSSDKLWKGVFQNDKEVYIAPFRMAKYELTYRIWEETRKWAIGHGYTFLNDGWKGSRNNDESSELEPVTKISWCDAIVWCNAHTEKLKLDISSCVYLNAQTQLPLKDARSILLESASTSLDTIKTKLKIENSRKGFRLPTEEEWEYAARKEGKRSTNTEDAGKALFFTKLNSVSGAKTRIAFKKAEGGNFSFMKKELQATTVCQKYFTGVASEYFIPYIFNTKVVGTKRANYLGFHDMSGNIREFSCTLREDTIFRKNTSEDVHCVIRGGAWDDPYYDCTVGRRQSVTIKEVLYNLGFRLCCTQ